MKSDGGRTLQATLAGLAIALGCLTVGWLAIRTTAVELLPPTYPALASIAPHDPDRLLNSAMIAFVIKRGKLDDADYATVADAARAAPLDARPYMLVAVRHLMRHDKQPIAPLLEAGRRLDPRQPWTRVYLLDQYLQTRRYAEAATEFAVLDRLVGDAGGPIVAELMRMSIDPATSGAVRAMFARDPVLENAVLIALARSAVPPAQIFAIASPAARAAAGKPEGWGVALVATLTEKHAYREALATWRAIYRIQPAPNDALVYDGNFTALPGSAPFNWSLTTDGIGAADRADDGLTVNYYGREPGKLAEQLLLLTPGRYRLAFVLNGPVPSNGSPTLSWNIGCDQHESPLALDGAVPSAAGKAQPVAMAFTIPAENCAAQWLRLMGDPGQFPGTMTATIQRVTVQRLQAQP